MTSWQASYPVQVFRFHIDFTEDRLSGSNQTIKTYAVVPFQNVRD